MSYTLSVMAMACIALPRRPLNPSSVGVAAAGVAGAAVDVARRPRLWRDPAALVRGLGEGFRAIRETPRVGPAVAMFVALYAVGASLFVLAPLAVTRVSHAPTRDTGFLLALLASGVIASASGLLRWAGRRSPWQLAGVGSVVLGAALAGFAVAHDFRQLGILACVAGIGAAPLLIGADALVQGAVDPSLRARVFATRDVLSKATFLVCALVVGALAPQVGATVVLAAEGVVVAGTGLWLVRRGP